MLRRLLPLAFATFAIGTDTFVIAGILPEIARSLHVGVAAAGQLVTAYALAYATLSPVVAILTANWSRNRVLLAGLGVFVVANVLSTLVPSLGLVILCRVLAGLGGAAVAPVAAVSAAMVVPPEKRPVALSIVTGGIAVATALGSPIGTAIGSVSDWRVTLWFVAALGVAAAAGIALLMEPVGAPPPVGLRQRLAPLGDSRIATTLLATLLFFTGNYVLNTYVSQTFARATGGAGTTLALLLLVSGVTGAVSSFASGPLTARFGSRRVINVAAGVAAVDFALTAWTGATLPAAIVAMAVWGLCVFSLVVPQQDRLVGVAARSAPLAISLNGSFLYAGASASGVIGAVGLSLVGGRYLGMIGAAFFVAGLAASELANRLIRGSGRLVPLAVEQVGER